MKITIITVCYNAEKTIRDTLESVLKQTYLNYEYLIIDGKSTDATVRIVQKYEDKFHGKLKLISEKDEGLFDAMNKGIQMSSGDIIGILNADDILAHKNVFQTIIDHIKDCDGIYSNLLMLDENLEKPYRLFQSKAVSKKKGWHMPHPTLYLKKEVYKKYGYFDLHYKITADLDFMLRLIHSNVNLKYRNDFFVFMRAGGASTKGLKGYYENFKESYTVLKNNSIPFPFFVNIKRTIESVVLQKIKAHHKKKINKIMEDLGKPKYIQINTVCNGSTGKIMGDIQKKAIQDGYACLSIYGRRKGFKNLECIKVGGFFSFWFHVFLTTIFDKHGSGSYFKTKKIVKILRKENPDIIHLHNIHGYYLNYKVLFRFLKTKYTGRLLWTFHDCWPFTGHCPYFTAVGCDKWKKECHHCPNKKRYPSSLILDASKSNFRKKKEMFTGLSNLTIITPSDWLNKLVKQSFLKEYPVITINNTIDKHIFKPMRDTTILDKYQIPKEKKVILGVASIWEKRKGFQDFLELSKYINDFYCIVLVGLNRKQLKQIQKYKNIYGIKRTENQQDLAALYSYASVFVNPTYEDNYPTVNLEAKACGTKIICYNTGGCSEQLNEFYDIIVPTGDIKAIAKALK